VIDERFLGNFVLLDMLIYRGVKQVSFALLAQIDAQI